MNIKLIFYRIILLHVSMILASCASLAEPNILIGSKTCSPPCWMGIQPGLTKIDHAIEILNGYEKEGKGELIILDSGILNWRSTKDDNLYIYKTDVGLVSKMELDLRSNSVYIEDLIVLFGEPSNLDIGKGRDGYFFVTIFYPEKGLAFVISGDEFDVNKTNIGFVVQPKMIVIKGVFFQPSDVTPMVHLLYGVNAVPEALSNIQEWKGYGVYNK
jgi:hypothetical protein